MADRGKRQRGERAHHEVAPRHKGGGRAGAPRIPAHERCRDEVAQGLQEGGEKADGDAGVHGGRGGGAEDGLPVRPEQVREFDGGERGTVRTVPQKRPPSTSASAASRSSVARCHAASRSKSGGLR